MAELLFPLQFKRQYANPLDVDSVFETQAQMNAYLTNARRYAGQIVTCKELEGKIFVLNNTRDAWLDITASIDLSAYYTTAQTYSKTEVDNLIYSISGGTGVTYLRNLLDVSSGISNATHGQALVFDSSINLWVNSSITVDMSSYYTTAQTHAIFFTSAQSMSLFSPISHNHALSALTDVVSGATNGQFLQYNSAIGKWIPVTATALTGNFVSKSGDIMSGELSFDFMLGTSNRILYVNSAGTIKDGEEIVSLYFTDPILISELGVESNWSGKTFINPILSAITVYEGQKYIDSNYFYEYFGGNLYRTFYADGNHNHNNLYFTKDELSPSAGTAVLDYRYITYAALSSLTLASLSDVSINVPTLNNFSFLKFDTTSGWTNYYLDLTAITWKSEAVLTGRTVMGVSGLTGGGTLNNDIFISHATKSVSKTTTTPILSNIVVGLNFDPYGHVNTWTTADFSGIIPQFLTDLQDVNITNITQNNFQYLRHNGTQWVNSTLNISSVSGLSAALDNCVKYNPTITPQIINGNVILNNDLTVQGALNVNGTVSTLNTQQLYIKDNVITLNHGETGAGVSGGTGVAGIIIDRGTRPSYYIIYQDNPSTSGGTVKIGINNNLRNVLTSIDTPIDSAITFWTPSDAFGYLDMSPNFIFDKSSSTLYVSNIVTTYVNTEDLNVKDNLITINSGETGSGVTNLFAGIRVDRGYLTDYLFIFDEIQDNFRIGESGDTQAVATREDYPIDYGIPVWNSVNYRFDTSDFFKYNLDKNSLMNGDTTLALGNYSHAEGSYTKTFGTHSHSEGIGTEAQGEYSHAEGSNTISSGISSHSEGSFTVAKGQYSHSEGEMTTTHGNYSHAEGTATETYGDYSHTEGELTITYGYASHAEGEITTAYGNYSHAEGSYTISNGISSHAEGYSAVTNGFASHAEGNSSVASGNFSHAEGDVTNAIGYASHSEGYRTTAYGNYSHSEGYYTIAIGDYSFAGGYGESDNDRIISNGIASFNFSHRTSNSPSVSGISSSNYSAILGGTNNSILKSDSSAILGGINNVVQHPRSIILGGSDITSDATDTVYGINFKALNKVTTPILSTSTVLSTNITATTISASTYYGFDNTHTDSLYNVSVGINAGLSLNNGTGNTLIGYSAGQSNISGNRNTFLGFNAGNKSVAGYNTYIGSNSGYWSSGGSYNVGLGESSLYGNTNGISGSYNIGIGYQSDNNLSSGSYNISIGYQATYGSGGANTKTGLINIGYRAGYGGANGNYGINIGYEAGYTYHNNGGDIFIGYRAGYNTHGLNDAGNVFIGYQAGLGNNSGYSNTFIGYNAGSGNTTGNNNVFLGYQAGRSNTIGYYNIFIGASAGLNNINGNNNTFLGYNAGYSNTASNNTFIGFEVGFSNTSGSSNTFVGYQTGRNNTNSANTFVGYQAGYNNNGDNNLFIGYQAGVGNTSGFHNTFIGFQSGLFNTTGYRNTFIGYSAGLYNTGYENTFIGVATGAYNTGNLNTFIGFLAGSGNTSGQQNTFLGYQSGRFNTTGSYNMFIGHQACRNNTTGGYNTILGYQAGYTNTTGSSNVFIGYQAGYDETGSNKLYISNSNTSNPLIHGDFSVGKLTINNIININGRNSLPSNPSEGDIIRLKSHPTLANGLYVYNGSSWVSIVLW